MPSHRKLWLDWQRGLAVLFMVEVHVLDAWLSPAAPRGGAFAALLMIGGFAAPGFLYMAGFSQALADAAQARKGVAPADRRSGALRRAAWLLGVAYGFRLAEFLLGGAWRRPGGWHDLLKVDILNVIAIGLALAAALAIGRPRRTGALLAGAAALALVLATPAVADVLRHFDLPRAGHAVDPAARVAPNHAVDVLLAYLYGSWPRANFSLFNWVAFLLAGAAFAPLALGESRPLRWLGLGAALFALGWAADHGPDLYAYQNFWRTSPAWFAMRLGICAALTGLLQLVPASAERPLAWLATLGRQSLVGYIASVELTYGALMETLSHGIAGAPLRRALSFRATLTGMLAMVVVTWAISAGWERLEARRKPRARASSAAVA
ncbi:heparan-alpha-glucosaminide N-acetyltransferase domain-containing protein [Anaeromyxobacter oryzisoli]|uniref:heparan-alpha-glucosaminide N-acetyltransferase domain-containing protein n=1 Tax=Anaeromyxobacter oryzisoli TaxID=2925408 RepID=UPI001F56F2FB|nr:heparan-alpha-glucosaminide N-acetyltransferase domain-containing protein [Anaeromyxobacter sp. SG63]